MKNIWLLLIVLSMISCLKKEVESKSEIKLVETKVVESFDNTYDNMSSEEKNNALIEVSANGDLEAVKALINTSVRRAASGASVNFQSEGSGFTALMVSSEKGHLDIVKYLVDTSVRGANGADLNIEDNYDGFTALMRASYTSSYNDDEALGNKYLEIVKYLIENGADVNIKTKYGHTALTASMQHGGESPEVVKYLIDAGADINAIKGFSYDYSGNTVWQELMEYNSTEIINYLIENKADISDVDIIDRANAGWLLKVKESIDSGVDINFQNNMKYTALISASQSGHLEIVKYLVVNGADVNIKNHWEHTALMAASENNHTEIIEYLTNNEVTE